MSAIAPPRTSASARSVLGLLGVVLPLMMGAAACSAGNATAVSQPSATTDAAPAQSATVPPSSPRSTNAEDPASTAEATDAGRRVQAALDELVRAAPEPSREQVRSALGAAGFDAGLVEVSASRTPTGLDVEAVDAGVPSGEKCVMAQIRSGTVTVALLPALPNGQCFVGTANG